MSVLDPKYLDAIKKFEGYSPKSAWDYKQHSSGYGTVAQPGDASIPPDQLKAIHEQRYQQEIAKAASYVDNLNPNLPPGARAALVSLTYNAGPGWQKSGLGELVRNNDLAGAAARLQEYNKAGGQVNPGLVARRAKEAAWFTGEQPTGVASALMGAKPPATPALAERIMGQPSEQQPVQQAPQARQLPTYTDAPIQAAQFQPLAQAPSLMSAMQPLKPLDINGLLAALGQV